jgi:hypothetical protein
MPSVTRVKHNGVWKEPTHIWVKHNGVWRDSQKVFVKHNGVWEQVFPNWATIDLQIFGAPGGGVAVGGRGGSVQITGQMLRGTSLNLWVASRGEHPDVGNTFGHGAGGGGASAITTSSGTLLAIAGGGGGQGGGYSGNDRAGGDGGGGANGAGLELEVMLELVLMQVVAVLEQMVPVVPVV